MRCNGPCAMCDRAETFIDGSVLSQHDPVNHLPHYTRDKIEVIDFIEDQQLNYHLGQVIKYVCRAGHKSTDTYKQDLQKAQWYLNRAIEKADG